MLNIIFFITLSHGRYLHVVCIIWNSKSVQLILFKLCTVFIYILKMFTCYYTRTNKDWGYKGITSICLSVHPDFVAGHISVYKNAYNTGMFCSDAILVLLLNIFWKLLLLKQKTKVWATWTPLKTGVNSSAWEG